MDQGFTGNGAVAKMAPGFSKPRVKNSRSNVLSSLRPLARNCRGALLSGCALALCFSLHVSAAPGYSVDWDAIAGGGGVSIAGRYTLVDISGQPDVGEAVNEPFRWEAGFLPGLNLQPAGNASSWVSDEDTTLFGTLTGSDLDGDLLTFALDHPPARGTLVLLPNGTFTYTPDADYNGPDSFTFKVNDGEFDSPAATATLTINAVNDPPTVARTPAAQAVQYSDPILNVAIEASDADSPGSSLTATTMWQKDGAPITEGLPEGLALALTTTTADGRTWTLSGAPQVEPGTYLIFVTVTDDQEGAGTAELTVEVTAEDARTVYTGAVFASTASASSSAAIITLSATIQDITAVLPAEDPCAGDIRQAKVTFINCDDDTVIVDNVPVGLVNLSDPTTGTATYNWKVDIGSADSQSFTVGIVVNWYYTRNASADDTVVTVSKPLPTDFVTGGGYLLLSRSAGLYAGDPGTRANFGFNVKFNKKGHNLQGNINVIVRCAGRVYQAKGNAMNSLSITAGEATFNGKASIMDITDPLDPISIDGNAALQVKMTDNGDPGSTDTIAITVWNKSGGLWFASAWTGTATAEQELAGGNLVVRSARALTLAALPEFEPPKHPLLLTIDRLPGPTAGAAPDDFVLRFPVVARADYALERSDDLVTWTHLTTVMSFTDAVEYFDEADPTAGGQFYRVRALGESVRHPPTFPIFNLSQP